MVARKNPVRRLFLTGLVGLAAAAGLAPAAAAQDCKLSLQASPQVLYSGQSARVDVLAHFPVWPDPLAPYAFASAAFDVLATNPWWTNASSGAIVGNDVLGAAAGQAHRPHQRIYANPANPFPVWRGVFTPLSRHPALVEIEVAPTEFAVYPSQWTSSQVECHAQGGNDYILVNPLRVGRWLAAPGPGTSIEISDDVVVDGRIITGENWNSASVGIVPSGTVDFIDSSTRVEFDGEPVTFTATVQGVDPQRSRVTSVTVTFDGLENQGRYIGGVNFCMADGSVRGVRYGGYLGGVFVGSGDLNFAGDGQVPGLIVPSLPQTIGSTVKTGAALHLSAANTYAGVTMVLGYDEPVVVVIQDADGRPQAMTVDQIELYGIREAAARMRSSNNLKQLGLGCHVFEAEGVSGMRIIPQRD